MRMRRRLLIVFSVVFVGVLLAMVVVAVALLVERLR